MSNEPVRTDEAVRVEKLEDGAVWRAVLNTPKANILDRAKTEALTRVFDDAHGDPGVKAIVIEGEGPNFSFGASVQEHLPGECSHMLTTFHGLFRSMLNAAVVTVAVVRGQCLGGGLELAAFCNRVFASEDARLGQPEIVLGVFAPVASVVLRERMGLGGAEDMLLSGRTLTAREARERGLVDQIDADPGSAALDYVRQNLLSRSASSLRWAVRAARRDFGERFMSEIVRLESMYLNEMMRTADANEGLRAFLEKRAPEWRNR